MRTQRYVIPLVLSIAGVAVSACSGSPPPDGTQSREKKTSSGNDDEETADSEVRTSAPTEADEGEACGGGDAARCRRGLVCSTTAGSGTCRRAGGEGEACTTSEDCREDLSCMMAARDRTAPGSGQCAASRGEEGDRCGGVGRIACNKGLTCRRSSGQSDALGTCEDDDEPSTRYCEQLSRCCGRIAGIVQRLGCGGTVAAGNEKACAVTLALCGG